MRRRALTAGLLAIALSCACVQPAAAGVEPGDESWFDFKALPGLGTTPDWNTAVYQSYYTAGPVHETSVRGRVPAARYWSFAILDQANREIANLSDFEIETDAGGNYELAIRLECGDERNCLETTGGTAPSAAGRILYRLYVPDTDTTGGAPLPQVEYAPSVDGADVAAELPTSGDTWSQLNEALIDPLSPGGAVHEGLAEPSGREGPVPPESTGPPPEARRFDGIGGAQVEALEAAGVPPEVIAAIQEARGQGGFGATADNAYVTMEYTTKLGNLVIRAKAPTYRRQHKKSANKLGVRNGREQVRYWSLCTTQATRSIDCVRDEQVPVDRRGFFTAIVAPDCPVDGYASCLRAGAMTSSRPGMVIYRNLLAAPNFANAAGPEVCPGGSSQFCGDYALVGQYVARP